MRSIRFRVLGEFASGEDAVAAVRALASHGVGHLDAYTPYPVDGMAEALSLRCSWVRYAGLLGGALGGTAGYFVQWWMNAFNWPLDVGDRPPNSWPAFILLSYEGVILSASFAIVFALLASWRLPNLHHPALGATGFESASGGRFWVEVSTSLEKEREDAVARLSALGAAQLQVLEDGA